MNYHRLRWQPSPAPLHCSVKWLQCEVWFHNQLDYTITTTFYGPKQPVQRIVRHLTITPTT